MSFTGTHANGVVAPIEEQHLVHVEQASMESSDRTRPVMLMQQDQDSGSGETNRLDSTGTTIDDESSNTEGISSYTSSMVNAAVAAYEEVAATMSCLPTHNNQTGVVEPVMTNSSVARKCVDLQRCPPPSPPRHTTEDTASTLLSTSLLGKRKLPPPRSLLGDTATVSVSSSSSATVDDTANTAATNTTATAADFITTTNTATTDDTTDTTASPTQEETGLKLLFAASLLQQQNAPALASSSSQEKPLTLLQHQHQKYSAISHLPPPPAAVTAVSRPSLFADTSWSSLTSSASSSSSHLVPKQRVDAATRTSSATGTPIDAPTNLAAAAAAHPVAAPTGTAKEENGVVTTPTASDVLCGRGGLINKHQGNIAYRRVVDYNKSIYKQVPKRHRILVSRSIVQTIQNHGGRFLQQTGAAPATDSSNNINKKPNTIVWTCIPMRRAVQKTSQALREPVQTESPAQHAVAATVAVESAGEKKVPLKSC